MWHRRFESLAALFILAGTVRAVPTLLQRQDSITALTTSTIGAFKPYSYYAAAAHCPSNLTGNWTCGPNCQANPNFEPVASGGDGDSVQFWFVGFDPSLNTTVVSHQGTNTSEIMPLLTDADVIRTNLNSTLFPGISSDIEVHSGFQDAQQKIAEDVLSAVQTTISRFNAPHITLVGHSLGAAIALLDAVYLPLHISNVSYSTVVYGLPRVGNQEFADYVDANVTALTRINNKEDPIPIIPGIFLGYHHPSHEVHINDNGTWDSCPGQDNPSNLCSRGDVSSVFDSTESDHDGPYDGVELTCPLD